VITVALTLAFAQSLQAQTFTTLYNFGGSEGGFPQAGLTIDRKGNLYGTAFQGGAGTFGGVFKLSRSGSDWVEKTLYSFNGGNNGDTDGGYPSARVVFGPDGSLYGTTIGGGESSCNYCGTVFKLTPPPHGCKTGPCPWVETILYRFLGGADGEFPYSEVVLDRKGNAYGTTQSGGSNCTYGCGTAYELEHAGGHWSKTVLYDFSGNIDGGYPTAGLIFDHAGNLYGTTPVSLNGFGGGTVFRLAHCGASWRQKVLYSFQNGNDGGQPYGGLILDSYGDVFGTTSAGGSGNGGTAFELSRSNGNWTYQLLSAFSGSGFLGPYGDLLRDRAGNLYGTTLRGGANGSGSVFKLTLTNGSWTETVLHDFTGGSDGGSPYGGVVMDTQGNLYGTASTGGQGYGIVWEITP
jgi:uncharacterized repeat protein (TIGR03803 family)